MPTKVLRLLDDTLKLIGVLEAGETASAEDAADMLNRLNDFIAELATQNLTIPVIKRSEYPLVASTATYTLGPSGDFDQVRPVWIDRSSIIQLNNPTRPIELPMETLTVERFQRIPVKNTESALPTKVYIDGDDPLRNVTFWPIPSTSILRWALYWYEPILGFTSATPFDDDIQFPPGYEKMLRYNLATEIAPEWGKQLSQVILAVAARSMRNIKRTQLQHQERRMSVDAALMSKANKRWDYRTGDDL